MAFAATTLRPKARLAAAYPAALTPRYVWSFRLLLHGMLLTAALFGSPVVQAAALCAIPLTILGDWAGGVRQLLRLVGLVLSIWLASTLTAHLGDWSNAVVGLPPMVGTLAGVALLFLSVMVAVWYCARAIYRPLRRRAHLRGADHVLGALVGTTEGVLLVAAGCWLLGTFAEPIKCVRAHLPSAVVGPRRWVLNTLCDVHAVVEQDRTGQWLTRTNPLAALPAIQSAQIVAEIVADPDRLLAAIEAGQLESLGELPEVRKYTDVFANDPALRAALARHDLAAVLADPQVMAMLSDRALHRALLEHRSELQEAIGAVHYEQLETDAWNRRAELRRRAHSRVKDHGSP